MANNARPVGMRVNQNKLLSAAVAVALGVASPNAHADTVRASVAAMPLADRLEITHVHAAPEGDVKFPPIDPAIWRKVSRHKYPAGPNDSADFSVTAYLRR